MVSAEMDHYLDIRVTPDPEFKTTVLMNALFAKLHRALAEQGHGRIGVSFPRYDVTPGDVLRLHGTADDLKKLMSSSWYRGLTDYMSITDVKSVPDDASHRCVRRVQKRSPHNKRKRVVNKGWLSAEEAVAKFPDSDAHELNMPYLQIRSLSSDNYMRIYIEHGPLLDGPTQGKFSTYGLSRTASIPWF